MGASEQQMTRWLRQNKKEFGEYLRTTEDWIGMSEKKKLTRWVYQSNSWIDGYVTEQQLTRYIRQDNYLTR
jgi:hypothetical protein